MAPWPTSRLQDRRRMLDCRFLAEQRKCAALNEEVEERLLVAFVQQQKRCSPTWSTNGGGPFGGNGARSSAHWLRRQATRSSIESASSWRPRQPSPRSTAPCAMSYASS